MELSVESIKDAVGRATLGIQTDKQNPFGELRLGHSDRAALA
jgi:hypothetical protein